MSTVQAEAAPRPGLSRWLGTFSPWETVDTSTPGARVLLARAEADAERVLHLIRLAYLSAFTAVMLFVFRLACLTHFCQNGEITIDFINRHLAVFRFVDAQGLPFLPISRQRFQRPNFTTPDDGSQHGVLLGRKDCANDYSTPKADGLARYSTGSVFAKSLGIRTAVC